MNTRAKLLALATCFTATAAITLALGGGLLEPGNGFNLISVKAASKNRNKTINYGNTYRGFYSKNSYGKFTQDLNSVFFEMQDRQAYGYIHTSGAINITSGDNCIAAIWSQYSTCYFRVNSNYMENETYYTSQSNESKITKVEFRKPTQIVVVLDKGAITDRCLDIECDKSSSAGTSFVDDAVANTRTYTYVIDDGISEGAQISFDARDAAGGRAIWIRSMTFYYDC